MNNNFTSDSAVFDQQQTRWGHFHSVAEYSRDSHKAKVKVLVIDEGKNISYQKHNKRAEVWNILSGKGTMVIQGLPFEVEQGDIINLPLGSLHTVRAHEGSKLEVLEIQFGDETEENDIERVYYEWNDIMAHTQRIGV